MLGKKGIILIGGLGNVGRYILSIIIERLGEVHVDVASRNVHKANYIPNKVGKVTLDLHNSSSTVDKLSGYDLAILTIGPFEEFKGEPHRLCIEAGVDCLDVNDSLSAAYDIFRLDGLAKEKGVRVFTGMGLNPGLSTFMLHSLLKKVPEGQKRIKNRLFGGAKENSGAASVMTMLSYFGPKVNEIRKGKHCLVAADDDEEESWYRLPGFTRASIFIHCPSVEAWTLKRSKEIDIREIERCDYRVHFQGLPMWVVRAYRRHSMLRSHRNIKRFGKFMAFLHERNKGFIKGLPYSAYGIECSCNGKDYIAYVTGYTVDKLTALLPTIIAELCLKNEISPPAGVHCIEDGFINNILEDILKSRNIEIVYR
jgi:hypothetical protein